MNVFSRLNNLNNIQKAYGYYRDLVEKPELRNDPNAWLRLVNALLKVKEIQEMLAGYKTYIMAAGVAALAVLHFFKLIDDQTFTTLMGLFAGGGLAALRAGVAKMTTK